MTTNDRFERTLSTWLHGDAEHHVPEHLDQVLARTSTTRQRPSWSSLERWLPVDITARRSVYDLRPYRSIVLLAVIALVIAALIAVAVGARRPPPPYGLARNGTLITSSDGDIFAIDPKTGTTTPLVVNAQFDFGPLFSRDGSKFSFLRNAPTDCGKPDCGLILAVANADGTGVRELTTGLPALDWLDWSPDGSMIAFDSAPADVHGHVLDIINVDGSGMRTLDVGRPVHELSWLPPAGDEIVFRGERFDGGDPPAGIFAVRPDGTGLREISTRPAEAPNDYQSVAVSPNGSKVSYQDAGLDQPFRVHILDLRTGLDRTLAQLPAVGQGGGVFSPDGLKIAYVRFYTDGTTQLALARSTAAGPTSRSGPASPSAARASTITSSAPMGRRCSRTTTPRRSRASCRSMGPPRPSLHAANWRCLPTSGLLRESLNDFAAGPGRAVARPGPATIGRMAHRVTLIPGDGICPELAEASRRVLDASGIAFEWEVQDAGERVMAEYGTPLPEHVLESIKRNKVALKGPITTPVGEGFRSVNVALRQALGLYANLRPARSMKGLETRYEDVDLVIVRENTEDLYAGIEHRVGRDAAESIKIITREASERIARFAFEYAVANGRHKVTAVHKANIMKLSDGLFLESCRTVAADYDGRIEFEDRIVDNMCMQLVQKPELYDVLVLPNLYGDIVSDLAAGLVGGLGVAPGANIGAEAAVFEAVHGSAPKYAGLDKANPTAMILSGALMLRHLGHPDAADRVETAVREVIAEGKATTYDLGGPAGTMAFADAIVGRMAGVSAGR